MDSQHVLVSGPSVMDPAKITVRLLEGALEETESSTTSPEGPLPVQEVFSLATPSKTKWGFGVKSLAKELDRGPRCGVEYLLSVKAMNVESSFTHCRSAVHVGPNLALLRLKVPVKAVPLWDRTAETHDAMSINPTVCLTVVHLLYRKGFLRS